MKKQNKYIYYKVLQGFYCGSWEDLIFYNTKDTEQTKEIKSDLKAYRENEKTAFRVIKRRVLRTNFKQSII